MVYFHYNFVIRTHIYINQKITFIFQPFLYNPSYNVFIYHVLTIKNKKRS